MKLKLKVIKFDKEMFDFRNYLIKSKYYDNANKLVVGKMKDDNIEHKKA